MLRNVEATYHPTSGDTTIAGRRFSEAYPAMAPTYVAGSTWFVNNDPIMYNGRRYVSSAAAGDRGQRRDELGGYQGTNVFVDMGTTGTPTVIYLLVWLGCEFQPYQAQAEIKVRGRVGIALARMEGTPLGCPLFCVRPLARIVLHSAAPCRVGRPLSETRWAETADVERAAGRVQARRRRARRQVD